MYGLRKNAKNLHFWAFSAKILEVFGQNWQNGNFSKKLGTYFSRLQALTNCKVSERSNEWFPRNCVTDGRTNERTWFLRSPTTSSRDQKKMWKPPFLDILGQKGQIWTVFFLPKWTKRWKLLNKAIGTLFLTF